MEAITASLERSLQNCSLNNHNHNHNHQSSSSRREQDAGIGISSSSDDVLPPEEDNNNNHLNHNGVTVSNSDTTLELNSHISLPYHWEQCLDLKTGEIYYINWRNGMKAKEDPRRVEASREYSNNISTSTIRDYYESDQDEEEEEEEEEGWYDSEESSSESCPSSSKEGQNSNNNNSYNHNNNNNKSNNNNSNVLVVAGCKSCLMYFMVPKQVEDCPKCNGQLLHFDRSENGSP